jgi:hypothetical protein
MEYILRIIKEVVLMKWLAYWIDSSFMISLMLTWKGILTSILLVVGSDHYPIYLLVNVLGSSLKKTFFFENFWLSHSDFQNNLKEWWWDSNVHDVTLMYFFQQ